MLRKQKSNSGKTLTEKLTDINLQIKKNIDNIKNGPINNNKCI